MSIEPINDCRKIFHINKHNGFTLTIECSPKHVSVCILFLIGHAGHWTKIRFDMVNSERVRINIQINLFSINPSQYAYFWFIVSTGI